MPIPSSRESAAALTHKLLWLEAMRAAAALWVLLHHAVLSVDNFFGGMGSEWRVLVNGNMGVDFFFVLSGFIIALSAHRLAQDGHGLREYLRARLLRIYVPYLPVGLTLLALFLLLPGLAEGRDTPGLLTSLTLIPTQQPPALSVAWTLVHELVFYLLYALFFVSRPLLAAALVAWCGAIVAGWLADVQLSPLATYFLAPLNLCFLLGVVAFHATRAGWGRRSGLQLLVLGLVLLGSQAAAEEPARVLVALGFAAMVMAAATPAMTASPPPRLLVTLGAASYAIYLVHNPALSAGVRLVRLSGLELSTALVLAGVSAFALLAGWLYFRLYEQPTLRLLRERRDRHAASHSWRGKAPQ